MSQEGPPGGGHNSGSRNSRGTHGAPGGTPRMGAQCAGWASLPVTTLWMIPNPKWDSGDLGVLGKLLSFASVLG